MGVAEEARPANDDNLRVHPPSLNTSHGCAGELHRVVLAQVGIDARCGDSTSSGEANHPTTRCRQRSREPWPAPRID